MKKRFLAVLLALALLLPLCPVARAEQAEQEIYGSIPILIGYADVDYMAEELLKEINVPETGDRERIKAVYDWIIYNCERYEWDGTYYFDENQVMAEAELYAEEADQLLANNQAVIRPEWAYYYGMDDESAYYDSNYLIAAHAYDMMLTRTGDCVHFSALLAVLLGHLGYDCRLIPGGYINADGTEVRHKWNCVLVNGDYYWLDVRIDHSIYHSIGSVIYDYLLISDEEFWDRTHNWDATYSNLLKAETDNILLRYNTLGHEHELQEVAAAEPDCTSNGCTAHYKCTICGDCYLDPEGEEWISPAEVNIPALGHDWEDWVVVQESTYDEPGLRERTCRRNPEHVQTENTPALKPPFQDVKSSDYFFEPVLWAVTNGITSGVSDTRFAPNDSCTRAQVVTFLWRAAGEPEPTVANNPFTDVKASDYFYKAVQWAVEKGITTGTSSTRFSPSSPCTRGQVVTFLHRAAGLPEPGSAENPFTDVKESGFYYDAVLWAVGEEITTGTSATSFSPSQTCTRGQVVTFLYRAN